MDSSDNGSCRKVFELQAAPFRFVPDRDSFPPQTLQPSEQYQEVTESQMLITATQDSSPLSG